MEIVPWFPLGIGACRIILNYELGMMNMKRIILFLLAILPMAFVLSTADAKPNKQKVVLYVDLHCEDCCNKILKNIPFDKDLKNGVKDLVFDLEAKTVTVTYDANKTDVPAIQKAFAKIGKPATTEDPKSHHNCEGHHHHAEGDSHHH